MAGEGIVRWDYSQASGTSHPLIPDDLADTDADPEDTGGGGDSGTAVA
jgi:hypothetical protein